MADRIGMSFGQMDQLLAALRNATSAIGGHLDELDEKVATLRGQWSGDASDAYDEAQRQSREQLRQMNEILSQSGGATDQILARHRVASGDVAKLWG